MSDAHPFWIGAPVTVEHGSGVVSGHSGVVVSPRQIKTDGRGIPTNISGAYQPVNWAEEVAVRLDSGELITMFKDRLRLIIRARPGEQRDRTIPPPKKTEHERMRDFFFPKKRGSYLMNLKSWK